MWNESKTVGIVFNGEIYNYRELREAEGLKCTTNTDTEVILKLYEKYDTSFIHRLRGMFAFGIYDVRTDTWVLARDNKGIKPLFLAYPKGKLAFASEMRSLMAAMPGKPALNMKSLSLYMRLQYVPGPETLCEGIEQVPPGAIITWHNNQETRTMFHPEESAHFENKTDFRAKFPSIMDKVVEQHMISDKPIGIFLSGGMDSSVVLHHMVAHSKEPVKTFTIRFDATKEEDAQRFNTDADLAALTAKHYGTDHHEILLTAELYRDLYKDTARALDQPNADSVSVAQFMLSREAKKYVDVALSGAGGDELFGGYPRYRIARILWAAGVIPPSMRAAAGKLAGHPTDVLRMQPDAHLAERLLARSAGEGFAIARGEWFNPMATTKLFEDRFGWLVQEDPVRAFMEFDRGLWLIDESLRLADATMMGSGLEGRVPFVDDRIVAASHATPSTWHVGFRRTKALLKDTYKGVLPDHLYTLKKASFYPPLAKWLRRECSVLVEEMLAHPRIAELFDVEELRRQFQAHSSREAYHLHTLSSLIQLSNWFTTVYDA